MGKKKKVLRPAEGAALLEGRAEAPERAPGTSRWSCRRRKRGSAGARPGPGDTPAAGMTREAAGATSQGNFLPELAAVLQLGQPWGPAGGTAFPGEEAPCLRKSQQTERRCGPGPAQARGQRGDRVPRWGPAPCSGKAPGRGPAARGQS